MPTRIKVEHCKGADKEHEESKRQYAHTLHRSGVICVARSFFQLPETHRLGLLLHEVGHVLLAHRPRHTEEDADEAARKASGVRVYYKDGAAGPDVEWIRPEDKERARKFLGL